jgi:sec-independent protein translocase protein TatA
MSMPGLPEIILIAVVVLLLFGGGKVKEIMRAFGEGLREFRSAATEATNTIRDAVDAEPELPSNDSPEVTSEPPAG